MIRNILIGVCIIFFSVSPVFASSVTGYSTVFEYASSGRWSGGVGGSGTVASLDEGLRIYLTTTSGSYAYRFLNVIATPGGSGGSWNVPQEFSFNICMVNKTAGGNAEAYLVRGGVNCSSASCSLYPGVGVKVDYVSGVNKLYAFSYNGSSTTLTEIDSSFGNSECHNIRIHLDPDVPQLDFFVDNNSLTPTLSITTNIPTGNCMRGLTFGASNKNTATMYIIQTSYFTFSEDLEIENTEPDYTLLVVLLVLLCGWSVFKMVVDLFKRVH